MELRKASEVMPVVTYTEYVNPEYTAFLNALVSKLSVDAFCQEAYNGAVFCFHLSKMCPEEEIPKLRELLDEAGWEFIEHGVSSVDGRTGAQQPILFKIIMRAKEMFRNAKEVHDITKGDSPAYTRFKMEVVSCLNSDQTCRNAFNGSEYTFALSGACPDNERPKLARELKEAGWVIVSHTNEPIGHNEYQWRIVLKPIHV